MEDGEVLEHIHSTHVTNSSEVYNTEFEWPGDSSTSVSGSAVYSVTQPRSNSPPSHSSSRPSRAPALLRLVILRSSVIPSKRNIALVDGHSELQIGRDLALTGSPTPRLRLKEMAVSKLHVTIYWDEALSRWMAVDMGSKHGTFLQSYTTYSAQKEPDEGWVQTNVVDQGVRLSAPRVSSFPKSLSHRDVLTVGSTLVSVHIHDDDLPCVECSPQQGSQEISLFPTSTKINGRPADRTFASEKRSWDVYASDDRNERDPKKALKLLKNNLLTRHPISDNHSLPDNSTYTDRSARRRAMHSTASHESPGVPLVRPPQPTVATQVQARRTMLRPGSPPAAVSPKSDPSTPLPDTNMGHRLLMKQGWQPGASLGLDGGVVEPINVVKNADRSGLGMASSERGVFNRARGG